MSDHRSPQHILNALNRIEKELPSLVGHESWLKIKDQYHTNMQQLRQSQNINQNSLAAIKLVRLLKPYAQARQRLNTEIELQALIADTISHKLQPFSDQLNVQEDATHPSLLALQYATHWSYNPQKIPSPQQIQEQRTRFSGTLTNTQPIRLKTISFDMDNLSQLIMGKTKIGVGQIENPDPRIIAAGVLATITTWASSKTVTFSEQDITIFGGMIQLSNQSSVNEHQILETANAVCKNYGMPHLNETQVHQSLTLLKKHGYLRQKQSTIAWQIISSFSKNGIVKIELPFSLDQFNIEEQNSFIVDLSRIVNINPDDICIVQIGSDRVIIALEMPEETSETLMSMSQNKESELKTLPISKIELLREPIKKALPDSQVIRLSTRVTNINLGKLREFTVNYFNESDLKDICFDEDIDYESLPGQGKRDKARELVAFFKRHGRIDDFVLICCQKRPNIPVIDLIRN